MEAVLYKKLGTAGAEGVDFQLSLILTTLLRAHKLYADEFLIYSEWTLAGCLDDVVLQFKDHQGNEHFRFLQAKHVMNEEKTITYGDLFSSDKFKIEKYFESYKKELVKEKKFEGKIQDLILFSNLSLNKDVLPYVEEVLTSDSIFHFNQTKTNEEVPTMHKLNSKFIEEYQYSKLRVVVKVFLDHCLNGRELKATNKNFKDCHVIMSTEVVKVEEGKFREKFINAEGLSEGTEQFRKILLEELKLKDDTCSSEESQEAWMRGVSMTFMEGFGTSKNNNMANFWPTKASEDKSTFKEFCNLFVLATSQPNDEQLISLVQLECEGHCRKSLAHLAAYHLQKQIRRWFKTQEEFPLNFIFVKEAMDYIKNNEVEIKFNIQTERNIQALSLPFKFEFQRIPYEEDLQVFIKSEENVFRLLSKGNMKVSLRKLFNCLDKQHHQIDYHFWSESDKSQSNGDDDFFEAFINSAVFNLLICEMRNNEDEQHLEKRLERLIENKKNKKCIFVYNQQVASAKQTQSFYDNTYFQDLTEETQKQLSQRKISFQGEEVAFNSIYGKEIPPDHQDIESWELLLDNQFKMNKTFAKFDSSYYVNRTLTRNIPYFNKDTIQQKLGNEHIVSYNIDDFFKQLELHPKKHVHLLNEVDGFWCMVGSSMRFKQLSHLKEGIYKFKLIDNDQNFLQKVTGVYVISDMAGYGKTTTTSYLANELQRQHPNCWVTRLTPLHLDFDAENIEDDFTMNDEFLMEKLFKLTFPLERFIFKQYLEDEASKSQLFFIFDGFDEIGRKYQKVIINAVKYLKTKRNVKFIGIGTRPHYQEKLEDELQSVKFKLLPFSHENKITFLGKFWESRGVKDQNDGLRVYSNRLIDLISQSISDKESGLTGIPLQMRMVGEIYEEGAIKYLAGNLEKNKIVAVDLFGLYEQFIKKKEDVYFNDKLCLLPSTSLKSIILKPLRKILTEFAMKVILGGSYEYSKDQLIDSIGFGIIQKNQGECSFIHRTFAEFLLAKYFLDYTMSVSQRDDIVQLMQIMYQENCGVVRKFINSKLDYKARAYELKKPEYKEATQNIEHAQFQEAMITSSKEGTFQLFCFQLEFYAYWYPEKMIEFLIKDGKGGRSSGLYRLNKISLCIHYMTKVWLTSDHNASLLLLQMFEYLITEQFMIYSPDDKWTVKILTGLQDELEEKEILSEEYLKSILFGKTYNLGDGHQQTFKYLKHLKVKHVQLFYLLLQEKKFLVQGMVTWAKDDEFYELFGETSDPHLVYRALVVSLLSDFKLKYTPHFDYTINLESYLKFISKFIRHFHRQELEEFKTYLLKYIRDNGWYYKGDCKPQVQSLLEFLRNHRDIISLEEFMQNIKIHKKLSFIENCALWGWDEDLIYILDVGDIEVEIVDRLQLERCESLAEKIKCILKSIRDCNTDEQLMEIARVNHQYEVQKYFTQHLSYTILSKAIIVENELRIKIYSTWITSDELFDAFMTDTLVYQGSVKLVINTFPQYKMRFFEINKNGFIGGPAQHEFHFPSILKDDNILNKEEFLRLNQLQNDDGETKLFNICKSFNWDIHYDAPYRDDSLSVWLQLMKREYTTDDIVRLFRTKNVEGKTVFQILNNKNIESWSEQEFCKRIIYLFFERMKLGDLMAEIDIGEEEVQDEREWFDEKFSSSEEEESSDEDEISEVKKADGEGFTVNEGEEILQGEKRKPDMDMDEGQSAMKISKQQ